MLVLDALETENTHQESGEEEKNRLPILKEQRKRSQHNGFVKPRGV